MKRLLLVLILSLSFQSLTRADDIRDFEIEGMSIGDSLLDYFNENEIKNSIDESARDKIYLLKTFENKNFDLYEAMQLVYKKSDKKKIIVGLGGALNFPNNIKKCRIKMNEIASELSNLFPNANKIDWGKYDMPTKQGHYFPITFEFENGTRAMVSCQDWNKKSGIKDNLKVSLFSAKYNQYLQQQNN